MEIIFSSSKIENVCTQIKSAKKFFGGDMQLSLSLHARINALASAETLHDIIVQPQFRFHNLHNIGSNQLEGYFAINVKTAKEPWRIILQPLDENRNSCLKSSIDEIACSVRIVKIIKVSKHYE